MENTTYYCPVCGEVLEEGQYEYDYETGDIRVTHCPWCGEEGSVVETDEEED